MSECHQLEDFLAGFLEGADLARFEAHLRRCSACSAAVGEAREADEHLRSWLSEVPAPEPSQRAGDRLVADARAQGSSRIDLRILVPLAAAAGVAIALAVHMLGPGAPDDGKRAVEDRVSSMAEPVEPRVVVAVGGRVEPARGERGEILSVDGDGRLLVDVDGDRIGLDDRSRAEIVRAGRADTLIRVSRGEVGFDVVPRRGQGSFRVAARGYTVVVVGTRFSVAVSERVGVQVRVASGEVAVIEQGGERHTVVGGRSLAIEDDSGEPRSAELDPASLAEIAALLDEAAEARPGPPDEEVEPSDVEDAGGDRSVATGGDKRHGPAAEQVEEAAPEFDRSVGRQLILEGRYSEAQQLLEEHLASAPGDGASWMLLADCRRKAQDWQAAVDAYRRVVGAGSPRAANRARFRAAVVLQDRLGSYRDAAQLLDEYLQAGAAVKPLESEAMLRSARASLALGQRPRAISLLEQILEHHAGTSAAVQARQLLSTLEGQGH
jgi:TolA-binding protein